MIPTRTTTLTATKEQLVNCLDNLISFVRDIYELLNNSPDNSNALNDMKVSIERLDQDRQNVINLELRMCVVASMKAGKVWRKCGRWWFFPIHFAP